MYTQVSTQHYPNIFSSQNKCFLMLLRVYGIVYVAGSSPGIRNLNIPRGCPFISDFETARELFSLHEMNSP